MVAQEGRDVRGLERVEQCILVALARVAGHDDIGTGGCLARDPISLPWTCLACWRPSMN